MTLTIAQIPDDLDPQDALLFGYAAGILDEALSLLAATYTAVNDMAAEHFREFQAIGGALFEDLAPVAVSGHCLDQLLARLEAEEEECRKAHGCGCNILPEPVQVYTGGGLEAVHWKRFTPDIEYMRLCTDRRAKSRAELMRMHPGAQAQGHKHVAVEYTLILDGAMIDCADVFKRGDLVARPKGHAHAPSSCPSNGFIALTVTEGATAPDFLSRLLGIR